MLKENKTIKFSKDFFIKPRPHVTQKEAPEDMIPFAWSKEVSSGQKEATLFSISCVKLYDW